MKTTESQLRETIREVIKEYTSSQHIPRKKVGEIKDSVVEYVKSRMRQHRVMHSVSVREDKSFQTQWSSEVPFKVTFKTPEGVSEKWLVVYDIEKSKVASGHRI